MLKTPLVENLKNWLAGKTDENCLAMLINKLLPSFRISPAFAGSKAEKDAERRQLLAEFLCLYKQQHGNYILMGEYSENLIEIHLKRRMNDFAMNCRSSYRQALIRRVNSVVRPANGFKKKHGRIVGRITDVENNIPTGFDEYSLICLWKKIAAPPVKPAAMLPPIKELIPMVHKMFSAAEGWVFKDTFYNGFETILRLEELTEQPMGGSEADNSFIAAIEEMAHIPASFTDRVALAMTIRKEERIVAPRVELLIKGFSRTWLTICRCMLTGEMTAAETSIRAGITQQGCGKAARTIIQKLRAELCNLDKYRQLAFIHTFVKILYSTEHGEKHE